MACLNAIRCDIALIEDILVIISSELKVNGICSRKRYDDKIQPVPSVSEIGKVITNEATSDDPDNSFTGVKHCEWDPKKSNTINFKSSECFYLKMLINLHDVRALHNWLILQLIID